MGIARNVKVIFLTSLFLLGSFLILFSTPGSSGGISVWPPDVTVDIKDVFPEEEIKFNIRVNNLYANDVNVSAKIENQNPHNLKENYTNIPDLSWIKVTPNIFNLSAKKSKFLEVTINIPDEEKPLHYNELWEACVVISEIKDKPGLIAVEYAIRIYIKTPERAEMQISNLLIILLGVVGFVALVICVLYLKNGKRTPINKKSFVFYFKKRKLKNKEKR